MKLNLNGALLAAALGSLLCVSATAGTIPAGYVNIDVGTDPGNGMPTYEFDITNNTGVNSSTDFPVTTQESVANPGVIFDSLSLQLTFANSSTTTLGSGYFSPAGDGLSFFGSMEDFSAANPIVSATLTGTFDVTNWTLLDSSTPTVQPGFSATITDAGGSLMDQDLAVINGTTVVSATPEPSTWLLAVSALAMSLVTIRRGRKYAAGGAR